MSVIAQVESAGLNDVQAFAVRVADELAAAASTALVVLGDRLGMYRSMTGAGALSPPELAARVGCAERYVREWLANQAAGGYVVFDPDSGRFMLPDAHAAVLAGEGGPAFLLGSAQATAALYAGLDRLAAAFRGGAGIAWDEQPEDLHEGCARLSRVAIEPYLPGWIAAISGIAARLAAGGRIADFGCGRGSAALLLARTFPAARVVGVDSSPRSIAQAREAAHAAGLDERVSFHLRAAEGWRETPVDLVCLLDALHDAGDPVGVARAARMALAPHGALLLVEPAAGDRLEDNLHAVGRGYYAVSTGFCTPSALSQAEGFALGAQAGPARLQQVLLHAGFTAVERIAQTPFQLVLQARVLS